MRLLLASKVMLFTVLVPGTVTLYIPYSLVSGAGGNILTANLFLALPAALCFLIGGAIYLRCAWDFAVVGLGTPAPIDPPKKLVATGAYLWNRNPMYLGVLLILLAECLLSLNGVLLMYTSMVALMFNALVIFYEEPMLGNKFGDSYRKYCAKVPRWGLALRDRPTDYD